MKRFILLLLLLSCSTETEVKPQCEKSNDFAPQKPEKKPKEHRFQTDQEIKDALFMDLKNMAIVLEK